MLLQKLFQKAHPPRAAIRFTHCNAVLTCKKEQALNRAILKNDCPSAPYNEFSLTLLL